jgi:hypothetical protein
VARRFQPSAKSGISTTTWSSRSSARPFFFSVHHCLVGPLQQQICRGAARIAPARPDALADALGLVGVALPLEFRKQRVERIDCLG